LDRRREKLAKQRKKEKIGKDRETKGAGKEKGEEKWMGRPKERERKF